MGEASQRKGETEMMHIIVPLLIAFAVFAFSLVRAARTTGN